MVRKLKYVCASHFQDKFIKQHVRKTGEDNKCSFCDGRGKAIDTQSLAEFIEEGIRFEYDDPYVHGAQYNPTGTFYEDRFPGVTVYETKDLLADFLSIDGILEWDIAEAVAEGFENNYWAPLDGIWGPTRLEYNLTGWDKFCEIVKHKARYLFFSKSMKDEFADRTGDFLNPYKILDEVSQSVASLRIVKTFLPGELNIYRTRQHLSNITVLAAGDLGTPPIASSKANRMSPEGIPMFYAAFDKETCVAETINARRKKTCISTGVFTNVKEFRLIDFTKLNTPPSLFDKQGRKKREQAEFLIAFSRELSLPVKRKEETLAYIPTQIVTEFFKYRKIGGRPIDGLVYNSVKHKGGKCVVLFVDSTETTDRLKLPYSTKVKLILDETTITKVDI